MTEYPQVGREPARRLDSAPADGTCPAAADVTNDPQSGALFDTANGLRQTGRAMMAHGTGSFTTPATGLVVVAITILPL